MTVRPSTSGYDRDAAKLTTQYENCSFAAVFAPVMHFFPISPCRVLDVGAGSGRDAAALAERGHAVVAVEPTDAMREAARELHAAASVTWLDDALPELALLRAGAYAGPYDFILIQAVWMHLDADERERSMRRVAELLPDEGRALLSLRHGPVPEGRRMFAVAPEETVALAERSGLRLAERTEQNDLYGREGVRWTFLCLAKRST